MERNGTFTLNGKDVEEVDECVHLCIHIDSKSRSGHTKTIDERIQSARRGAYTLVGAGLYDQNKVKYMVPLAMCNVFIF